MKTWSLGRPGPGPEVEQELNLIKQHEGITASPVMNMESSARESVDALLEDYTQYIPRGHYTWSTALQDYFKTMTWYGRLTFRAASETRLAVLITLALNAIRGNTKSKPNKQERKSVLA